MTLGKRDKLLAVAVGGLLVLVAGQMVWNLAMTPLANRKAEVEVLQGKLDKKKQQVEAAAGAQKKLAEWRRRALPSDPQAARVSYHNWLLELAERVKLHHAKVESSEGRAQRGVYQTLPFMLRCQGTLEQLTTFLYDFYSAGHLHQVRALSIKPIEKSEELELVIGIEALSLPDADRRNKLTQLKGDRLADADPAVYRKAIVERNLFAPYKPPAPSPAVVAEKPPESPPRKMDAFDPGKHTYVTAIVSIDGEPEVWLRSRTKDQNLQLREGQAFEIGPTKGTIAKINGPRSVDIEIDGKRTTLAPGDPIKKE